MRGLFRPARRLCYYFQHLMSGFPASFATKLFNGIAVKAQYLKSRHPSFCFQSLIDGSSAGTASTSATQFLSVRRSIIVDMVKAKRIDICAESTTTACHRTKRVIANRGNLQLKTVLTLCLVIALSININPSFIEFPVFFLNTGFVFVSLLVFTLFLFIFYGRHVFTCNAERPDYI